ncbi:MAG: TetR/AcrR family transcriptional regulator [Spirochaetales bacterium]|nr:TetR/AcrR family transcriptional regulator [Spirochaetales bacterium]
MAVKSKIKGIDNRKLILDTANTLFKKQGAQKTSLSDIAKKAGISKGTLYYYYTTKRELIYDIARDHMETITRALIRWLKDMSSEIEPMEILAHVYRTVVNASQRSKLHLYLIEEAISGDKELMKRFRASYTKWNNLLSDGFARILPKNKKDDIPALAALALTSITGSLIQHQLGNKQLPYSDMARVLLK